MWYYIIIIIGLLERQAIIIHNIITTSDLVAVFEIRHDAAVVFVGATATPRGSMAKVARVPFSWAVLSRAGSGSSS